MQGDELVLFASAPARADDGSATGGNLLLTNHLRLIERAAEYPSIVRARGFLNWTEMLGMGKRSHLQIETPAEIDIAHNFQLPLPIGKQQGIDVHVSVLHAEAYRARPEPA